MTDDGFDAALVAAAFDLGAEQGWRMVSAASACQRAGLDLSLARRRFPSRLSILARFGALADAEALRGAMSEGPARDRLFDILLRRFDFLQGHRPGVLALLKALPLDPALALWAAQSTSRSMAWMLEGAGLSGSGLRGDLRATGLLAVWGWGLRAWIRDESADLSATMAAVDTALDRAGQVAARFDKAVPPEVASEAVTLAAVEPDLPFAADPSGPPA